MEEKIVHKMEDNNIVYYLVKIKDSYLLKKISREELMKKNKKLIDEYELGKKDINTFINKKRKNTDSNKDSSDNDLSSEETQRMHFNNKNKNEKKIESKLKSKLKKELIIDNKKNNNFNNIKEKVMNNKENIINKKNYKEDYLKLYEREGKLLVDKPKKILNVGYKNRSEKKLYCLVEWEQNEEYIRIIDSIIECDRIKKEYPYLLLDFYESKLVFLDEE